MSLLYIHIDLSLRPHLALGCNLQSSPKHEIVSDSGVFFSFLQNISYFCLKKTLFFRHWHDGAYAQGQDLLETLHLNNLVTRINGRTILGEVLFCLLLLLGYYVDRDIGVKRL